MSEGPGPALLSNPPHRGTEVELVGEAPGPGGAPHSGKSDFTILHLL